MAGWSASVRQFAGAALIGCPLLWFGTPPAGVWLQETAWPALNAWLGEKPPMADPLPRAAAPDRAAGLPAPESSPASHPASDTATAPLPAAAPVVPPTPPATEAETPPGAWASVCVPDAPLYARDGTLAGTLSAGDAVTVLDVRMNRGEAFAIVLRPNVPGGERGLMRTRDLLIRQGDPAAIPAALRALYAEEARTLADLDQARAALSDEHARANNPHAAAYEQARTAYRDFLARAKAIRDEWENADGDRRASLADTLRLMKNEEAQLAADYKRLRQDYEAAGAAAPPAPTSNAQTTELELKLDDIRARLAQGVPADD